MKRVYTLFILLFVSITLAQGQTDPLSLSKAIFSRDSFPALQEHITGEYSGHPNGTDLPINSTTDFLLLDQNEKSAVVNVTITDSAGSSFDGYLHFIKTDNWKVTAFRALAMTGFIENIHDMLKNMTHFEIDSMIRLSNSGNSDHYLFKSKEEYLFELGNTQLTIQSDQEIIEHFLQNENEFNRIKDKIIRDIQSTEIDSESSMKVGEKHIDSLRKIYISSVYTGGFEFGDCLDFLIGGMIDNKVGYLFAKEKSDLPRMNPNRIIMIREIGKGWYMYKTT